MKNSYKILILSIWLSCFIPCLTSADNSDCWTFWIQPYQQEWKKNWFEIVTNARETNTNKNTKFLTIEQQKAIITNDDLNTAILNLKKYCCEKEEWWLTQKSETCINDKAFFNDNSLDSPYLYDHIFDVIMRRLNWLSGETNIYTKTNMTLDDKWASRREWIDKQALSQKWSNPQTIIDKYKEFRTQSSPELWYDISENINSIFWNNSDQDLLTYVSWQGGEESKSISNALKDYDKWSLQDRYINACALSEYFYALLNIWPNSSDKFKIINEVSKKSCQKITESQIEREGLYVSLIEQRSSNLFLSNYLEWYTSYLHERQLKFQDLINNIKNRRLDIIRAVPELQRQCNKW